MRKAFIGLSTPIGYDYGNMASRAKADTYDSPNPILDSPFGLLLLFDQLVFLTRSLCPENMRNLSYVSFLDESEEFPIIQEMEIEAITQQEWSREIQRSIESIPFSDCIAEAVVETVMVDNHTHGLDIGGRRFFGNADARNFAIDALICSKLNDPFLEMVSNTRFQKVDALSGPNPSKLKMAEIITIEGIPNYISINGPYNPCIEDVRQSKYLQDFRRWIEESPKNPSKSEIIEIKSDVENALKEAQEKVFLKYLDPKKHYQSIGKAIIGDALGVLCPAIGTISSIMESTMDASQEKGQHWQGFIVDARRKMRI